MLERVRSSWDRIAAAVSLIAILLHLIFRYGLHNSDASSRLPLWIAIVAGGLPLLYSLLRQVWRRKFGADFLAGVSIVTATLMGELLVATIIILMLSGGQAPVDGTVKSGTGTMDESFLTGEPYRIRKTSGSQVISGALNEDAVLTIVADKLAVDSRYARIMRVMREAEESPPEIRRLADRLGVVYTPIAVLIALAGWLFSGQSERFLAVLVIATPCPLLLAIPISIIGAISLSAKRGIVIKKPADLARVGNVRTMLFDKTGTLTHGEPLVTEVVCFSGSNNAEVLRLSASLEQYSKHPLAGAILRPAHEQEIALETVENISEKPGEGLRGQVGGRNILVTGRRKLKPELAAALPGISGMECVVMADGQLFGLIRFHDRPRKESKPFIHHLAPKHHVRHLMILSGDRDIEVQHLAEIVGIEDVRAGAPEQKLQIVRDETAKASTLFLGDGINDAPAMLAATVGVAFGQSSDITAEAAGAVILEPALEKVDELLHIGKRMRRIALESAIGGMALSSAGMIAAALGYLPPVSGAIGQEIIDLLAVLNALRASIPGKELQDF